MKANLEQGNINRGIVVQVVDAYPDSLTKRNGNDLRGSKYVQTKEGEKLKAAAWPTIQYCHNSQMGVANLVWLSFCIRSCLVLLAGASLWSNASRLLETNMWSETENVLTECSTVDTI